MNIDVQVCQCGIKSLRVLHVPLVDVPMIRETLEDLGMTAKLQCTASGGHFLEMSAVNKRRARCVRQPAHKTAAAIYAFCKKTFGVSQDNVCITA